MSKVEQVHKQLMTIPLEHVLRLCAQAIEEKMDEKRIEFLLITLETRLQKERMIKTLGLKPE